MDTYTETALEKERRRTSWLKSEVSQFAAVKEQAERVPGLESDLAIMSARYECLKVALMELATGNGTIRLARQALEIAESFEGCPIMTEVARRMYARCAVPIFATSDGTPELADRVVDRLKAEGVSNG